MQAVVYSCDVSMKALAMSFTISININSTPILLIHLTFDCMRIVCRDIWYTDYTTLFLVPYCHSFYLGMLNDVFMAIKEKTGMAPFNALDKVMDQMSLTTDFNRQLKHCVGSTGNLFPCYTCEDYLNFIEIVLPSALCVKGINGKKNSAG